MGPSGVAAASAAAARGTARPGPDVPARPRRVRRLPGAVDGVPAGGHAGPGGRQPHAVPEVPVLERGRRPGVGGRPSASSATSRATPTRWWNARSASGGRWRASSSSSGWSWCCTCAAAGRRRGRSATAMPAGPLAHPRASRRAYPRTSRYPATLVAARSQDGRREPARLAAPASVSCQRERGEQDPRRERRTGRRVPDHLPESCREHDEVDGRQRVDGGQRHETPQHPRPRRWGARAWSGQASAAPAGPGRRPRAGRRPPPAGRRARARRGRVVTAAPAATATAA